MSDYVHTGRRSRVLHDNAAVECRLMFGACYALFLIRAVVTRAMPWRKTTEQRESVFGEAHNAASVLVTSSFMGM
ncbi:hypothetical protein [Rhodopseudomonas pseudopalustris]|uniref:Uncharacterized protein n=2 Tax=Rhodopseudomonas TaxID=1073 RepID=Q132L5_RHOPS|nr:hypothetical protein [Rhodopseudomonas pseudopalustris]ABE40974.1 hypothetical protein RPD_3753 [Rhodopseudomonas palustris BisB5]MBB1091050.1 hypothetical protein [Rhodopseudomonas palustris]SEO61661.1 hypothetical protein SAMN05444123_103506 [Rhodopseudomonas pseudopalustris]